jgi:hypothetical protein
MVPVEGIEPTLLAEHDFESCASTSSATRALSPFYIFGPGARLSVDPSLADGLASAFRIGTLLTPPGTRHSNAGDETAMTQATMTKITKKAR